MRDRFGIFGAVIRIRKLSLLLVVTLRMPNSGADEGREIKSFLTGSGSMPRHRRMHIMREGRKVATDEDELGAGSGKHGSC
jgi:hypothetical protein